MSPDRSSNSDYPWNQSIKARSLSRAKHASIHDVCEDWSGGPPHFGTSGRALASRKMAPRVKVCGVVSKEDACAVAECGGDAVGLILGLAEGGVRKGLTKLKAKEIVASLPPFVSSVLVTTLTGASPILELAGYVGTSTIQLHGDTDLCEVQVIRMGMPGIKLVRTVHVTGKIDGILKQINQVAPYVDAILLDSIDPLTGHVGGTGIPTNWQISRQIRYACPIPVILAGGLRPDTVIDAIQTVMPWGVDVQTGVEDTAKRDGSKDIDLVRQFVLNAKFSIETRTEFDRIEHTL